MESIRFRHSDHDRTAFDRELVDFLKDSIEDCEGEIWRNGSDLIISIPNRADDARKFFPQPLTLESLDDRLKKLETK